MPLSYIVHNQKEIMFADYANMQEIEKQLELLEEVATVMPHKGQVRLLVDYSNMPGTTTYMNKVKDFGNTVFKDHMLCSAVLGVTGLKKILFDGYNRATGAKNVKTFSNKQEALDWLAAY